MERQKLIERKEKAESMGLDTIIKYHQSYIGVCKALGICGNGEYNKTDIASFIIRGLEAIYGDKYKRGLDDMVYYYVCKGDMRAVCIVMTELLERGVK